MTNDFDRTAVGSVCMATCTTLLRAFQRNPKAETEADGGGAVALGATGPDVVSWTGTSSADDSDDSEERDSNPASASEASAVSEGTKGRLGRAGKASGRQSSDSGPSSGSEAEEGRVTGKSGSGWERPRAMGWSGRNPERTASTTSLCPQTPRSSILQLPAPKWSFCVLEARFGSSILKLAAPF